MRLRSTFILFFPASSNLNWLCGQFYVWSMELRRPWVLAKRKELRARLKTANKTALRPCTCTVVSVTGAAAGERQRTPWAAWKTLVSAAATVSSVLLVSCLNVDSSNHTLLQRRFHQCFVLYPYFHVLLEVHSLHKHFSYLLCTGS